jgi:hypothetical protein
MATQAKPAPAYHSLAQGRRLFVGATLLLAVTLLSILSGYLTWAGTLPAEAPDPRPEPVPNGYFVLAETTQRLGEPPQWGSWREVADRLSEREPDLAALRRALQFEFGIPSNDPEAPNVIATASQWLALDLRVAEAAVEPVRGLETSLDLLELVITTIRGGEPGLGFSHAPEALLGAEQFLNRVPGVDSGRMAMRLESLLHRLPSAAEALPAARASARRELRLILEEPSLIGQLLDHPLQRVPGAASVIGALYPRPLAFRALEDYYDALAERLSLPERKGVPQPSNDLLVRTGLAEDAGPHFTALEAAVRMLRVQLALREFWLEKGRYPDTLASLVTRVVPSALDDPFADGRLQYRLTPGGYVLYSVGPNGRDDGGVTGGGAYTLEQISDLVAGHLGDLPLSPVWSFSYVVCGV